MIRLLSVIITAISALVASGSPFTLRTRTALIRSSGRLPARLSISLPLDGVVITLPIYWTPARQARMSGQWLPAIASPDPR
jgi:hypothetical protein